MSTPMEQALEALRAGDGVRAETVMAEAARRAREQHGAASVPHVHAQFELARVENRIRALEATLALNP